MWSIFFASSAWCNRWYTLYSAMDDAPGHMLMLDKPLLIALRLQAGLALLRRDPKVFACHTSPWDAMFHGELGASAAVLSAGFNLDSLMARYQGVDWRQQSNWECNGRCGTWEGTGCW